MSDSEYSTDDYKSSNISIGAIIKHYLKTKNVLKCS